jgi:hypothetical protein
LSHTESSGSPRFLGKPPCALASLSDPGRAPRARPVSAQEVLPPPPERRRPCRLVISRLNLAALALAVYALQRGSPRTTQDSLPAGGQPLPSRVPTCRVRSRRFRCLHRFAYISPSSRLTLALIRMTVVPEPERSRDGLDSWLLEGRTHDARGIPTCRPPRRGLDRGLPAAVSSCR